MACKSCEEKKAARAATKTTLTVTETPPVKWGVAYRRASPLVRLVGGGGWRIWARYQKRSTRDTALVNLSNREGSTGTNIYEFAPAEDVT